MGMSNRFWDDTVRVEMAHNPNSAMNFENFLSMLVYMSFDLKQI
jgi:hypothetical protein